MKNMQNSDAGRESSMMSTVDDDLGVSTFFRCDSCQAQAFVAASKGELMLLFCGHHFRRHEDAMVTDGWSLVDNTHRINRNSSVSANAG